MAHELLVNSRIRALNGCKIEWLLRRGRIITIYFGLPRSELPPGTLVFLGADELRLSLHMLDGRSRYLLRGDFHEVRRSLGVLRSHGYSVAVDGDRWFQCLEKLCEGGGSQL